MLTRFTITQLYIPFINKHYNCACLLATHALYRISKILHESNLCTLLVGIIGMDNTKHKINAKVILYSTLYLCIVDTQTSSLHSFYPVVFFEIINNF